MRTDRMSAEEHFQLLESLNLSANFR